MSTCVEWDPSPFLLLLKLSVNLREGKAVWFAFFSGNCYLTLNSWILQARPAPLWFGCWVQLCACFQITVILYFPQCSLKSRANFIFMHHGHSEAGTRLSHHRLTWSRAYIKWGKCSCWKQGVLDKCSVKRLNGIHMKLSWEYTPSPWLRAPGCPPNEIIHPKDFQLPPASHASLPWLHWGQLMHHKSAFYSIWILNFLNLYPVFSQWYVSHWLASRIILKSQEFSCV